MLDKQQKSSFIDRCKKIWRYCLYTKSGRLFSLALVAIITVGVALITIMSSSYIPEIVSNAPPPKKEEPVYSPLTGVELTDPSLVTKPVTAVIIENSPDARPQSGLKQAGIVYEAIAEAGITRFLVLYQESSPGLIGPVRSVRPYYVQWASAYDPAVAHVGGSAKALKMIRSGDYGLDLDQFFNADTYWRASDRYAPHNVYTDSKRLSKLIKQKGKLESNFEGFVRQDEEPLEKPTAKRISIDVSTGDYAVSYRYNAEKNNYTRSQGNQIHKDREKGTITPKVVIALKVKESHTFEDGYRESITTTGKGEAYVFQNGGVTKATWTRSSATTPLKLTDKNGEEVALVRGQSWITALSQTRSVSWQ